MPDWIIYIVVEPDCFYAPNFEKVLSILVSDCPSVQTFFKLMVLKFHIQIPCQKIADPYFFILSELSPLVELCSCLGVKVQICKKDISKSIEARSFKYGQLIEDDEWITL